MASFVRKRDYSTHVRWLMPLTLLLIFFANPSGYISYAYTLWLFCVLNFFCQKESRKNNLAYFHIYIILAFAMYFIHRYQLPNYMGLTGPEGGIGTDDVRYYAGLPNVKLTYTTERMDIAENNPYTQLISKIYPFHINDPVEIVILNILGICFLPYLTRRTADILLGDRQVSTIAENLIAFCPFMLSIGLIIMRDIICTSIILVAFVCYAKKKYIPCVAFVGLLAFLKFGFVVFLGIIIACYYVGHGLENSRSKTLTQIKYILMFLAIVAAFSMFVVPILGDLTGGRITSDSLFRDSFLEYLEGANDGSILVKLYSLPVFVRIPALIVTFLIIPPLTLNIFFNGVFIPKNLLQNVMAPVFWWFLYYYLISFLLSYNKLSIKTKTIFWNIVLLALALGMISLQTRHKAVMIPFIYIATAYTMTNYPLTKSKRVISILLLILFVITQIIYSYCHL